MLKLVQAARTKSNVVTRSLATASSRQFHGTAKPMASADDALPPLLPPSVQSKEIVLARPEFTQERDSEECGFVAGQQIVNFHSSRGYVDRRHGQHWALKNKQFSVYGPEILSKQFQLDPADTMQMIKWLTKIYGMDLLLPFMLSGKSIQEVLENMKELTMDGLPQFQFLASSKQHAYSVHMMGKNQKFLTSGMPSGVGTYSPTRFALQSELIGSQALSLAGCKPFLLNLEPSYGFVSAAALEAAKKDPSKAKKLKRMYPTLIIE